MSAELKNVCFYILHVSEDVGRDGNFKPIETWPTEVHAGAMSFLAKIMSDAKFRYLKLQENGELSNVDFLWLKEKDVVPEGYRRTDFYEMQDSEIEVQAHEQEALKHFFKKRRNLPKMGLQTLEELQKLVA